MGWLGQLQLPEAIRPANPPDIETVLAIRAWNLMGGLDWVALPFVAEMLGIRDIELLIYQLAVIRNRQS